MRAVLMLFGFPVAVYRDVEQAEHALDSLPSAVDYDSVLVSVPEAPGDLERIWREMQQESAGPVSEANRPPVTLLSNGNKFR